MLKNKAFSIEELWTWFLRILMGLVSFLIYEVYQSVKSLDKQMVDIKIMIAEGQKDIYYLKEDHKEFKKMTTEKITMLQNDKHSRNN
jgi:surfactin synthase thioesterase subunit